jgi:hypothetical protein
MCACMRRGESARNLASIYMCVWSSISCACYNAYIFYFLVFMHAYAYSLTYVMMNLLRMMNLLDHVPMIF